MSETIDTHSMIQETAALAAQEAKLSGDPLLRHMPNRGEFCPQTLPGALTLCQPGKHDERSELRVLLAGTMAPVLPGLSAGGSAAALGLRGQNGSDPWRDLPNAIKPGH